MNNNSSNYQENLQRKIEFTECGYIKGEEIIDQGDSGYYPSR
jgi:hypothetical protein